MTQVIAPTDNPVDILQKRTSCYRQRPSVYAIAPCTCGNENTQWSEFERHLWCDKCEKDFIPEHAGIFSGPIAVNLCAMMGIRFDRVDLNTGETLLFDIETCEYLDEDGKPVKSPEAFDAPASLNPKPN